MSLRIRRLELRVATEEGTFGARLSFEDGLVLLRGENASGKSTCLAAVLYAVGLEGLLVRGNEVPFPEALTSRLKHGDRWLQVVESSVRMEIQNGNGKIVAVTRAITGDKNGRQVISVEDGPALSRPDADFATQSYFVRIPGAAQSEAGFHSFLAAFIGLELPRVPRFDQAPAPLYLEAIFPLFFVDQLRGWTGLHTRLPTQFRIVDLWTSTMEFLLKLDIREAALAKHTAEATASKIREKWDKAIQSLGGSVRGLGFMAQHVPLEPVADWPPKPAPRLVVTEGDEWRSLAQAVTARRRRLTELEKSTIPKIEQVAEKLKEEVARSEAESTRLDRLIQTALDQVLAEQEQLEAVEARLSALAEDRRKYRDEQRLRDRGGVVGVSRLQERCPTCKQPLKDSLLPQGSRIEPMRLEDNLQFVEAQLGLFTGIREEVQHALHAKQQRLHAVRQRARDQAAVLREQRRALRGDAGAPSVAAIRERILEEDRLQRLEELREIFETVMNQLAMLSQEWRAVQGRLRSTAGGLSPGDLAKLAVLRSSVVAQLISYDFKSFDADQVGISDETYRPVRDRTDLPSAVIMSASDAIRVIWAYLVALLEVARDHETNHVGLLIFDEPQQQHMKEISFAALVQRLAVTREAGQQVIVATSEDRESLIAMTAELQCQVIEFPDRILQPFDG